jgi:ubiquinone/menaquinone biosynthesis C-methylase UbiE
VIKTVYERNSLPPLLNCCCGSKPIAYQRKKIIPYANGDILEVGAGSGLNIPFYNKNKVSKIIALDPSEDLNSMAKIKAASNNLDVQFKTGIAENLDLEDSSIDTVVITYTLCTIPKPEIALLEIKRVLKSDGKILFSEHGIAPDDRVAVWQNKINPIWSKVFGGCNLNRDILSLIKNAGFNVTFEQMYLPRTPKFVGFNSWGKATKKLITDEK